jgi:hypothetical protein
LARRTTGSGRLAPGHNHYGFHPRNGLFTLVLILGGIWRHATPSQSTLELAADIAAKSPATDLVAVRFAAVGRSYFIVWIVTLLI